MTSTNKVVDIGQARPRILDLLAGGHGHSTARVICGTVDMTREQVIERLMRELDKEPEARRIRALHAVTAEHATDLNVSTNRFVRRSRAEIKYWQRQGWLQLMKAEDRRWEINEKAERKAQAERAAAEKKVA